MKIKKRNIRQIEPEYQSTAKGEAMITPTKYVKVTLEIKRKDAFKIVNKLRKYWDKKNEN
jgi:hypothetical protein